MGPTEAVLKYLIEQNRPYSTNDIFMNLHKEFGKTAVQKALDQLVEQEKIKEKVYGKQKVYAVEQASSDNGEGMGNELCNLDTSIAQMTEKHKILEQSLRPCESQLKSLLDTPTTKEAVKELAQLEEKVTMLKTKLEEVSLNKVKISATDREKVHKVYDQRVNVLRKRKRLCLDIVESILEGYPKDKKSLLDEIGIETDEAAGFSPFTV